jgi:sugar O-acyltransferase (sialic acid O-acetyltransferase NeuD family)
MADRLLIVGAGGHGRSVAEVVTGSERWQFVGFADDTVHPATAGTPWPVLGPTGELAAFRDKAEFAIVAIGNNAVRERLQQQLHALGFRLATVIHRSAIVAPSARLGMGCAVMAGAVIGTEATLGDGVIVNSGAVVDHHCRVQDYAHLGTNACMAGGSLLGRGSWMQAGAALGYGVQVPAGTVLDVGQHMQLR